MFILWVKLWIMWICHLLRGKLMKAIKHIIIIYSIFLVMISGKVVFAAETEKNVTIILVPDFSFQEVKWLKENGRTKELWTTGGMAAMNIRPDGPYSYLNNTVSLATGARGVGILDWNAFWKGEKLDNVLVEELYQQWTGKMVQKGVIFHPQLHKLVDKNSETTYRAQVGILGQTLKEHGVRRYVIGNSDAGNEKIRYAPLFVMDKEGLAEGFLVEATKKNVGSPWGLIMDNETIIKTLSTIHNSKERTFTVIEWGDLHRLYKQKAAMTQDYLLKQYEASLLNLELFINKLTTKGYPQDIMLLSPMVHQDAYQNKELLAPLLYWQTTALDQSFYLQSNTTRQQFVVSNLDIVPTILDFYNIKTPGNLYGHPLQKNTTDYSSLDEGLKKIDIMFLIFKTRNFILSSYITLLVILLITTSIIIMIKDQKEAWQTIAKILLISGISSPFWLLLTPYSLIYIQPYIYLLLLIICSFLTGFLVVKFTSNPIAFITVFLFGAITLDLFFGNFFMQRSYLGYDPVIGARYYGIGNEYAGVYLIFGLLLLERYRSRFLLLVLSIGHLFVLSSTKLGANAGATLSAGIMFGYFAYRTYFPKVDWRKLIIVFCLILFGTLALLFLTQQGKVSHIGYAFGQLFEGNSQFIMDTIKRKLVMNWKIFRFSNWTQLFVTTYLLIALYLWRKNGIVRCEVRRLLIQTGVVASVALLLLNDSGVVAAATSMFIIVCTCYYWVLEDKKVG